jgi:hypothetical protein
MKKYKCISSFTDDEEKGHRYGDKINESDYNKLTSSQKRKYQLEDEDSNMSCSNIVFGDMLGTGIPGGLDMDMTTLL